MNIKFVVAQNSGISYHRLINPMEYMTWEEGDSAEMLWLTQDEHKITADTDILYYNKFITMSKDHLLQLKSKGTKIVVDIDDSWDLPVSHPFYKFWTDRGNTQKVIDNIELADLVICTTLKLQDKVRILNKNTAVIPNSFPFGYDNYIPRPIEDKQKITFIYMAGSTHLQDVKLLEGKFKRIKTNIFIKDNSEFILAGYEDAYQRRYSTKEDMDNQTGNYTTVKVHTDWDKMASIFSQTGCSRVIKSTNLDEYINGYDQADIAIIPLCDTEWNSYKSCLKIVEAAVKGIPVICSRVSPYQELSNHEGIMWVEKPDDWITHFRYCIKNPNFVKDMGQKLHESIKKDYDLLQWNKTRMELFKSLVK